MIHSIQSMPSTNQQGQGELPYKRGTVTHSERRVHPDGSNEKMDEFHGGETAVFVFFWRCPNQKTPKKNHGNQLHGGFRNKENSQSFSPNRKEKHDLSLANGG